MWKPVRLSAVLSSPPGGRKVVIFMKNYVILRMDTKIDNRVPQVIAVCDSEKDAKQIAEKEIRDLFNLFEASEDADGFPLQDCIESGNTFFKCNAETYYIYIQRVGWQFSIQKDSHVV